jgi:hypothetical protein
MMNISGREHQLLRNFFIELEFWKGKIVAQHSFCLYSSY